MTDETLERPARWFGSLGSVVLLMLVAWAARLAMLPLHDNSFFTHLATGRIILDNHSVPGSDPYTYTAAGTSWTVQSWLASVGYAGAERLAGADGIRLLVFVVYAASTACCWALSRRATSLLIRLVLVASVMVVGSATWSERPYMIGVIGLAVVWLALLDRVPPAVLVPLLWFWANIHGSFVLAAALWATFAVGAWIDRRVGSDHDAFGTVRPVGVALAVGAAIACVSPLGIGVLLFPVRSAGRSEILSEIVEWQAPRFNQPSDLVFLALVLASVVALVHLRRWQYVLPTLAFVAAALLAQRNIVMACVVLIPVVAAAAPELGTLRSDTHPPVGGPLTALAGVLVVLVAVGGLQGTSVGLGGYPVRSLAWLDTHNADLSRVVTQEFTGNLLEVLDGPAGEVFVDDRADMFPVEVLEDYLVLNRARMTWATVLADRHIDAVVWRRADSLASLLAADPSWAVVFSDTEWIVACRRGGDCALRS